MTKKYRCFYNWDDKEVWAVYDNDNKSIKLLLLHDIVLKSHQLTGEAPVMIAKVHSTVEEYRQETRKLLEEILQKEKGILISQKKVDFPVYGEPKQLEFSDNDSLSSDNNQYKIFFDMSGNWFRFAARHPNNKIQSLNEGHLYGINNALEELLVAKGVDIKHLARYTPDGEEPKYHKPTINDFLKDYDIENIPILGSLN